MASETIGILALDEKAASAFTANKRDHAPIPTLVADAADAQVIVAGRLKHFTAENVRPGKVHILWTNEPGEYQRATVMKPFFPEILGDAPLYVFNAHNMLVYTDNYYYAPRRCAPLPMMESAADLNLPYEDKMTTFAAGFKGRLPRGHGRVTLIPKRQDLALAMHAAGRMRIIGRNWPDDISGEESRRGNRLASKLRLLKAGNFNLCYENTIADHYVTEKIWEAIQGGCLPIYHYSATIHHCFPQNSFIDGAQFDSPEALMAFIDAMPLEEYIRRVNACRTVYNEAIAGNFWDLSHQRTRRRLHEFVRQIVGGG